LIKIKSEKKKKKKKKKKKIKLPAAPFVGAVTTLPPQAFSSFTEIAKQESQSRNESVGKSLRLLEIVGIILRE